MSPAGWMLRLAQSLPRDAKSMVTVGTVSMPQLPGRRPANRGCGHRGGPSELTRCPQVLGSASDVEIARVRSSLEIWRLPAHA